MWNSLLISISKHPFLSIGVLFSFAVLFLLYSKNSIKCRLVGFSFIVLLFVMSSVFHFRWDSFAIHFSDIDSSNIKSQKILFIGDSITSEGTRPRGYITKLESILPIKSKIICSKGATSLEILRLLDFNSTPYISDLVIAQSGINDLLEGRSDKETLDAQDNLLNKIRSKYANANVIFLPIHPFFKDEKFISSTLAPSENSFDDCWKNATSFQQNYLMMDGIHLNARGHTFLADAIARKMSTNLSGLF